MEEEAEPQEWVERAAEEHHHGHAAAEHSSTTVPAITAAVLAVLASLGSLLSGHAANEAVLAMIRTTDQWAYFQSISTKGHLYDVGAELVTALGQSPAAVAAAGAGSAATEPRPARIAALDHFRAESRRYEGEKAKLQREADAIREEGRHELHKHHRFALAVAAFQVGIVLASVSLLVRLKAIYALSLVAGAAGVVCLFLGLTA
jgi:Domain of unknown function (DUF4337)